MYGTMNIKLSDLLCYINLVLWQHIVCCVWVVCCAVETGCRCACCAVYRET